MSKNFEFGFKTFCLIIEHERVKNSVVFDFTDSKQSSRLNGEENLATKI